MSTVKVIDCARVRNWLAGRGDFSPYPGMLHDPTTDIKLDWSEAVRKVLWTLPEGARVTITVDVEMPEAGTIEADDYWTLLEPHHYGHVRERGKCGKCGAVVAQVTNIPNDGGDPES